MGALSVAVHAWDLLKEVTIRFINSTIVWLQVNSKEGTQLQPSTESWRFTEHGPIYQNKTQFPSQLVSLIRKLP